VVFDIGGVLEVTPRTGWERTWSERLALDWRELLRRIEPIFEEGETGALSLDEVERAAAIALGLHDIDLQAFMGDLWTEYLGTLNEPMAHFFSNLRPLYRTGILSNSFVGARERERAAYNFEAMCDLVLYSHEEGVKKPDPRFYLLACERLEVLPERVLFVDDTSAWVEAACRLGMTGVLFVRNEQAIDEIASHLEPSK